MLLRFFFWFGVWCWGGLHFVNSILGSLFWMAPEILTHQDTNPYTVNSDMYAYGVVLFELFAGELPYADIQFLQPGKILIKILASRIFFRNFDIHGWKWPKST